jgi:4-amino-4-deoxy-L-arabinose transferase-like glycosyltransferase
MQAWIEALARHPVWFAVLLLLAAALVYGLVKRLFKLALGLAVLLAAAVWFHYSDVTVPEDLQRLAKPVEQAVKTAIDKGGELGKDAAKKLREGLDEGD